MSADAGHDEWSRAIEEVLREPARASLVFQPIADLRRAVVAGYEALARFDGAVQAPPNAWFREADRRGLTLSFELLTTRLALRSAAALPPNCFLSINVSPQLLLSAAWAALVDEGRLDNVVLELTEHAAVADYGAVRAAVDRARRAGGTFAVDDTGSGFASLNHVLALRPDFVKIDRVFVVGCDRDPARLALVEMMGSFAGRLDAWIVAEGVETLAELKALASLDVPLAQGFLLARPGPGWGSLEPTVLARLAAWQAQRNAGATVGSVAEEAVVSPKGADASPAPEGRVRVLVDEWGRPVELVLADGRRLGDVLRVSSDSSAAEVLRRALVRPEQTRFAPVVIVDDQGRVESVARVERIVELVAFRPAKEKRRPERGRLVRRDRTVRTR
ncbi:MAG: EAL domain-containing protein [Vicinamibacteria bacterium]